MSVRLWGDDFSYLWRVTSVCFFVGMTACPGFGDKTIEDFNSPDDSVVTWDSHVSEILTAKCGSCHSSPSAGGAPASFRLDRYDRQEADNLHDGAFEKSARIKARSVDSNTMPPSGSPPLTDEEKLALTNWLMNGAKKTIGAPAWNDEIGAIISAQCGGCHSASPSNGVPTSFRLDVYNKADSGGNVDGAYEKRERIRARALDEKTMPPGGPLSASDQAKIQAWLNADAPLD